MLRDEHDVRSEVPCGDVTARKDSTTCNKNTTTMIGYSGEENIMKAKDKIEEPFEVVTKGKDNIEEEGLLVEETEEGLLHIV